MHSAGRLAYSDMGSPDAPAILFLHGFLGCRQDWDEITSSIGESFRTLTVDLPGHGDSRNLDDSCYTFESISDLVLALLDSLQLRTCHLVGYSMGARLALFLAVRNPERFNRIMIESGSAGLETDQAREDRRSADEQLARQLESQPLSQFLESWYSQPLFHTIKRDAKRFETLLARRLNNDPRELARALRGFGTGSQPYLGDQLTKLPNEILFAAGELDSKYRDLADDLGSRCPRGTTWIAPGAGHTLHFDQPMTYIQTLTSFLMEGV